MEVTNLLDIYTREGLYRWYLDNHDKVSDFGGVGILGDKILATG